MTLLHNQFEWLLSCYNYNYFITLDKNIKYTLIYRFYLLKAKEQAAAEKQPAIQDPNVPNAGKATQLKSAPMYFIFLTRSRKGKKKKIKKLGFFLIVALIIM